MGIKAWLQKTFFGEPQEVSITELLGAAQEFQVRKLALAVCINMIANAVSKCEFKTFVDGREARGSEYYLWNIEPNTNQSSSEFLHKLICRLYMDNEALIVATKHRSGHEMLVVADSFFSGGKYPAKMNTYSGVTVGDFTYDKTFYESEVIHIKLHGQGVVKALVALYDSYERLLNIAQRAYAWENGVRLKVKVDQIASGEDDFVAKFKQMMDDNVKPWLEQDNGVLPEFEGYTYEDMLRNRQSSSSKDFRELFADVISFTARCLLIPPVLVMGDVADSQDALSRWLTTCIDPLCDNLQENIIRKRYGFDAWKRGNYLQIDTTNIVHFDMFANAANVEKLIGSGCFSINRVLEAAGMPKINAPWADQHWLTLNIGTIEAAAKAAEASQKGGVKA